MKLSVKASFGIAAATMLVLAGCTATSDPATDDDVILRVAIAEPDRLVPANHFSSYEVLTAIFTSLTGLDEDGQLEYLQAESVESDDAVTWTITLRDGWTFHNGDPVTAQSYVDAWNYAAYAPNAQVNGGQLKNVVGYSELSPVDGSEPTATELSGLSVVDDLTFTVELQSPDRQYPFQLTQGQTGLYPLPAEALEDLDAYNSHPIGNGPFMLADDWTPSQEIETVVYEDYAGEEPTIGGVTFVPYLDTTIAYTDALAGEVDIVAISGDQVTRAEEDFGDNFYALDAPGVDLLGFPSDDPRFSDKRVRQAISMAIDREAINDAIYGGRQIPATSLTSPSMPGDPAGVCGEYCEFNPEAAQELLAEAGGFEGPMELLFIGGWGQEDLFAAYANQIRQNLGIEDVVATPAPDFAAFTERVANGDVSGPFRARWGALYPSQQDTLHSLYTAEGDGNFGTGGYSNPEVDALLAEADAAETLEESYEGYRAVQERILEDFPVVPTFGNRYLYVTSERVTDLYSISGSPLLSRVEVSA
ncbi:ABC transporter substrate-binding protein [Salinibacterium sp. SYSU T00001]|uniref:peptide ABC transporter substrate-binding protein n=1 Tax=Homoserinimonas sedimenticola TaxID=2986805 RepID=UPI002235B7E9|nr:ABC transporter substrate-binding protein [Salinibacterium sedimenticola]MCW4384694.1 ABC transporter substrate-binding protein [Salinibacterium sedimenticola]